MDAKVNSAITPQIVAEHGLSPAEYQRLLGILGREPSLTELGIFSVMWSEHCSYKSSKVHLKQFGEKVTPQMREHLMVGMGENAGVVDVGEGRAIAFKVESLGYIERQATHGDRLREQALLHPLVVEPVELSAAWDLWGVVIGFISENDAQERIGKCLNDPDARHHSRKWRRRGPPGRRGRQTGAFGAMLTELPPGVRHVAHSGFAAFLKWPAAEDALDQPRCLRTATDRDDRRINRNDVYVSQLNELLVSSGHGRFAQVELAFTNLGNGIAPPGSGVANVQPDDVHGCVGRGRVFSTRRL